MTIAKLSKSKKQLQIIDDDGNVFVTSVAYMQSLLYGNLKSDFLLFNRMPLKVNDSRFKKSPLWVPPGMDEEYIKEQEERAKDNLHKDAISDKGKDEVKQRSAYQDAKVW